MLHCFPPRLNLHALLALGPLWGSTVAGLHLARKVTSTPAPLLRSSTGSEGLPRSIIRATHQSALVALGAGGAESQDRSVLRKPVGERECKLFEKAFLVWPQAMCRYAVFPGKWVGCSCTIHLPRTINQLLDLTYNPYAQLVPLQEGVPTLPPLRPLAMPRNPLAAYMPPPMAAICPFATRCTIPTFNCVSFDTWGFQEVRMAAYTPATSYLKDVICDYTMDSLGTFTIPGKVTALWRMSDKHEVQATSNAAS